MKCHAHENVEAIGTCTVCGRAVCTECQSEVDGMLRCPAHDRAVVEPTTAAPPPPLPPQPPVDPKRPTKAPGLAFCLGLCPGLGHLYVGVYRRAFMILASFVGFIFMAEELHPIFGFGVAATVFYSAFDAVRLARWYNHRGLVDEVDLEEMARLNRHRGPGSMSFGIVLVVFGLMIWIDQVWGIDLSWLRDHWPLVIVGIGAYLITSAIRSHHADELDGTEGQDGSLSL